MLTASRFRLSTVARYTAQCIRPSRLGAAVVFLALAVGCVACGTVEPAPLSAKDAAGGDGAVGGSGGTTDGVAGGAGQAAGGAGGEAGSVASSGGRGGSSAGAGAAAGSSGSGGQGGEGNHPWTAPACMNVGQQVPCHTADGGFVELTVDGGVPGSGINSWRCETNCNLANEQQPPCTGTENHTYCVASCSQCF